VVAVLTVVIWDEKVGWWVDHGTKSTAHVPVVRRDIERLGAGGFGGWHLARGWVHAKVDRREGGRVEVGEVELDVVDVVGVVVEVSHLRFDWEC